MVHYIFEANVSTGPAACVWLVTEWGISKRVLKGYYQRLIGTLVKGVIGY